MHPCKDACRFLGLMSVITWIIAFVLRIKYVCMEDYIRTIYETIEHCALVYCGQIHDTPHSNYRR